MVNFIGVSIKTPEVGAFDIFPNPSSGTPTVLVNLDDNITDLTITVVDGGGKTVYEEKKVKAQGTIRHILPLQNLPKGMYYVRIMTEYKNSIKKLVLM